MTCRPRVKLPWEDSHFLQAVQDDLGARAAAAPEEDFPEEADHRVAAALPEGGNSS